MPRVRYREQHALGADAPDGDLAQRAQDEARGGEQGHDPRRQQQQHRHEHQVRRHHVARADRELDHARGQRVEARPASPPAADPSVGGERVRAPAESAQPEEQHGGHALDDQLAPVQRPRARLQESSSRRSHRVGGADVVEVGLSSHRAMVSVRAQSRRVAAPVRCRHSRRLLTAVGVDVDIVDRPGRVPAGLERDADFELRRCIHRGSALGERPATGLSVHELPASDRPTSTLCREAPARGPAQADVQRPVPSRRSAARRRSGTTGIRC